MTPVATPALPSAVRPLLVGAGVGVGVGDEGVVAVVGSVAGSVVRVYEDVVGVV